MFVIWVVDVSAWDSATPACAAALRSLPEAERERVRRFVFPRDQRLALGSRLLQRRLIHETFGVPWDEIRIDRTPEGKPFWHRPQELRAVMPTWNFNVSHHGTIVAIAAHSTALVGVDVMQLTERPRGRAHATPEEFFEAFTTYFTATEWSYIRIGSTTEVGEPMTTAPAETDASTGQYRRFFELWSLKESYIKAVGIGLGFELLRADFSPSPALDTVVTETATKRWSMRLDRRHADEWSFASRELRAVQHVVSVALGPMGAMYRPETSSIVPHLPIDDIVNDHKPLRTVGEDRDDGAWREWTLEELAW